MDNQDTPITTTTPATPTTLDPQFKDGTQGKPVVTVSRERGRRIKDKTGASYKVTMDPSSTRVQIPEITVESEVSLGTMGGILLALWRLFK